MQLPGGPEGGQKDKTEGTQCVLTWPLAWVASEAPTRQAWPGWGRDVSALLSGRPEE